jgi:hypothetical protein
MSAMSNPLSTYDLLYKSLSDDDRKRLESDIAAMLKASAEEANKALILGVQKAATEAYSNLLVNPWPALIQENASQYYFLQAISDQIWEIMLKSKPGSAGNYSMDKLVDAWRANYPEKWAEVVGREAAEKISQLEQRLAFEMRMNRREF